MPSTSSIIVLADLHADANPSAAMAATEAHARVAEGMDDAARMWALKSLSHSVGAFHDDYRWAAGITEAA